MLRYCPLNKDGAYNRGASLAAEDPIVAEIRRLEAEAAHLRARFTATNNFRRHADLQVHSRGGLGPD